MKVALSDDFLRLPIAHRALHDVDDGRPENSRAAIQAAVAAGFGIEIDLQLSADDQALVFHDYDLARLTGQAGPIRGRTGVEAQAIALSGGQGETIPSLADVLALVDGRVPLLIELKDQDGAMGQQIGALEAATAAELRDYDGPVALMSFNPYSVIEMARLLPDVPRGLTTCGYDPADWPLSEETCARLREIPDFEAAEASFISHHAQDLGRRRVRALWEDGVPVLCWTIRSAAEEAEARKMADNVTFEGYLPDLSA